MRKIAQELGVEAMSLYNHVARKDEISTASSTSSRPRSTSLPTAGTGRRRCAGGSSSHEVLLRHSWAAASDVSETSAGGRMRYGDAVLRGFREGRLPGRADVPRLPRHPEPRHGLHDVRRELRLRRRGAGAACGRFPRDVPGRRLPRPRPPHQAARGARRRARGHLRVRPRARPRRPGAASGRGPRLQETELHGYLYFFTDTRRIGDSRGGLNAFSVSSPLRMSSSESNKAMASPSPASRSAASKPVAGTPGCMRLVDLFACPRATHRSLPRLPRISQRVRT